ncbi:S66 peptidase family protein [Aminicella lysinilytica]|uniref:Muramoyltetrapeptide carboxypeptidase n=1 Tax=Aminicella lysinilytica TaxID=433323 RepID=A0A4R6Q6U8_9FIRM|nr:LD-carboxypeptidase [Aminicella lysinilytica]TDP57931.1 muramoyltetrapeptide carboxypeptidase [Aminicella lysinilytica]
MKYPKKLSKGDTIGLVAPSSFVPKERELKCKEVIESLGYSVKMSDNISDNYGGFMAGDGKTRGMWINKMFADPDVDAIFCVRGGDGGSRAMSYIDVDIVKSNPKIFVGYSDITSMHLLFNQKCNLVTFHGPMVSSNMIDDYDEQTAKSLKDAINADEYYEFKNTNGFDIEVLKDGMAEAPIVGGNLSLLSASIGTPYEIQPKGKILFIEEVGEDVPRLERYAYHLKDAGKYDGVAGIILGQFADCGNEVMPEYTPVKDFEDILKDIKVPIMYNIQSGHDTPMMTIPLGAVCKMDTSSRSIKFKVER